MIARSGSTLIELLVVTILVGVVTGVTTLAINRVSAPAAPDAAAILADSVTVAIKQSRRITIHATIGGRDAAATAFPDGSVRADSAFRFDDLTGRPLHAR